MSVLDEVILRERIRAVRREIELTDEARAWADGSYRPQPGAILPAPASREGWMAWERATNRVASIGPRIVTTYLSSAIHDVNWGGDSTRLDRRLASLDLRGLARRIAEDLLVAGIAAGYVYVREGEERPRIGLLSGYLCPYLDPMDRDIVTGLYQAALVNPPSGPPRYWVRVWDLEAGEAREWTGLDDPTALARPPARVIPGVRPRVRWWALTAAGLPTSPLLQVLPILRSIMATSLMMARLEELAAYPVPVFSETTEVQDIGPGLPIRGEFKWASPGSLEEIRRQYEIYAALLRDVLALPGGALGSQTPSGEALREANVRFRTMVRALASLTQDLLTELVADLALAMGLDPVPVTVITSPDLEREDHVARVINLYREGLLPIRTALLEIQPYVTMLTDEDLDAHARRLEGIANPEQLVSILGG